MNRKFCDVCDTLISGDYVSITATTESGSREFVEVDMACAIDSIITSKAQAVKDGYVKEVTVRRERVW